jgi:hypothetical protein
VSKSSPEDLAVAFRSFARRFDEAVADGAPESEMAIELKDLIARVAWSLDVPAGDLRATSNGIADAIATRRANQWTDSELDGLRASALEAGKLLRAIEATAGT